MRRNKKEGDALHFCDLKEIGKKVIRRNERE